MLKEGDAAPDFHVKADDGSVISLSDFRGKNVILYFYPKANTPGCTHEAVEFRDAIEEFQALNTAVVGVSGDSIQAQAKFKAKYDLNFPLLADTDFSVIAPYGARRTKTFLGKSFLGIVRSTYWIGPDGKVRKVWEKAPFKGHAKDVLAAVQGA